jgi:hypothetical protein
MHAPCAFCGSTSCTCLDTDEEYEAMVAPKPYKAKSLGYKRTPTKAVIRAEFGNGEEWEFPAQAVADSRDASYAHEEEDTIGSIREGGLDNSDLIDWLKNNMNWGDVAPYARKVEEPPALDLEEGWCDAECEVQGKV